MTIELENSRENNKKNNYHAHNSYFPRSHEIKKLNVQSQKKDGIEKVWETTTKAQSQSIFKNFSYVLYLNASPGYTFFTAFCAASFVVNVTKAYPRFVPVIGSIISLRSHITPHSSNNGISSSSNISFGILPQNTSHPLPGVGPVQFGGGPPYFR